jgi:Na+/melibiose symporter-like transporter
MTSHEETASPPPRTRPGATADNESKLTTGTLIAACFAVTLAQIGIAIPATLNGLFQQDLHPIGSQLTWISDAFLLPVAALELSFGVLGDLFGRKRLLVAGAVLLTVGELIGSAASGVYLLWGGQALAGLGAAALFPTSLAMLAAGTHTPKERARSIALWAGFLSAGGFLAPVLGGITGSYGSWRWSLFIGGFLIAEVRAESPLLRLDLFRNRGFAIAATVAVIGMFSFLGTAYATSIRLGPIQHQSPLRTSVPFLLLQGPAFVLIPLTSWLLERINPRWMLGSGLVIMAIGQFSASAMPISDTTLTSLVVPIGLVGVGFALTIASITATAVNTVPIRLAGMASATTSLLRDIGFTLGPAVIGAVALGQAATRFSAALPGAGLPAGQLAAAQQAAQAGGPLAVNGIEPGQPGSAAHQLAFDTLGHGYALGYIVCGAASLAAAIVTVAALRGGRSGGR